MVKNEHGKNAVVRIIGIKSFTNTGEFDLASYGEMSTDFLESLSKEKPVMILLGDKKEDSHGRLLASVNMIDQMGNYTLDIASLMVEKGIAIVYTRYPFELMDQYLLLEQSASRNLRGLWGSEDMRNRITSLKKQWEEVEEND